MCCSVHVLCTYAFHGWIPGISRISGGLEGPYMGVYPRVPCTVLPCPGSPGILSRARARYGMPYLIKYAQNIAQNPAETPIKGGSAGPRRAVYGNPGKYQDIPKGEGGRTGGGGGTTYIACKPRLHPEDAPSEAGASAGCAVFADRQKQLPASRVCPRKYRDILGCSACSSSSYLPSSLPFPTYRV